MLSESRRTDLRRITEASPLWMLLGIAVVFLGNFANCEYQKIEDDRHILETTTQLHHQTQTLLDTTRKAIEMLSSYPDIMKIDDPATRRLYWGVYSMIEHLGIDTLSLVEYGGAGPGSPVRLHTVAPYFKDQGEISNAKSTLETRHQLGFTSSTLFNPVEKNITHGIVLISPIGDKGAISALINVERFAEWLTAHQPHLKNRMSLIVDGTRLSNDSPASKEAVRSKEIRVGKSSWSIEISRLDFSFRGIRLAILIVIGVLAGWLISAVSYAIRQRQIARTNFETLINTMQSVVLTIEGDGRIDYANPFSQSLLGAADKDLTGLNIFDSIVPEENREGARASTDLRKMISGPPNLAGEISINENISLDGDRMWLAWTNRKIIDTDGHTKIVSVGNDVTKQKDAEHALAEEKKRADELLNAILPKEKVAELKSTNAVAPKTYTNVAVLFTDVVGFTSFCDTHPVEEVVGHLQEMVGEFERIVAEHQMEKIKTIGDAFMAVGGLLTPLENSALIATQCAFDFIERTKSFKSGWSIRAGIHIGPVQAGVIGKSKFLFDTFGDTVNTAARMESNGIPGKLTVSEDTWKMIQPYCTGSPRDSVEIKGKGAMRMYIVDGLKKSPT
jgi:PAS domain S-box-containing protein